MGSCSCSYPVSSQFLIKISFYFYFLLFSILCSRTTISVIIRQHEHKQNRILYQHYASKLQKFSHCKFKYEKPDFLKEHNKAREIQNETYPRPFISSSADPCFLVRPVNAKAFSAQYILSCRSDRGVYQTLHSQQLLTCKRTD